MKTLLTLALTTMMTVPAFAAETDNVKEVTDVYVQQHNIDVKNAMQASVRQDILSAISNFRVPLLINSVDMLVNNTQEVSEVSEQAEIE